ncbi:MAG: transposase [Phycisphaeraceae bacterium]
MSRPIVIAYHLIWTLYGWWLPNDPRGSSSHTIRCDVLDDLGALHHGRKRIQPASADIRAFYETAQSRLTHELLTLNQTHVRETASVFAQVIAAEKYTCYAMCIMPDHVHVLIRKHRDQAEQMIAKLQNAGRLRLRDAGSFFPANFPPDHPVWAGPGWKVFLDHPDELHRTITYIERNPLSLRQPVQQWPCITPYNNWPLHEGHSSNSPYVKALRAAGRYP